MQNLGKILAGIVIGALMSGSAVAEDTVVEGTPEESAPAAVEADPGPSTGNWREFEAPSSWFRALTEDATCIAAPPSAQVSTFQWAPEPEASDPLAGVFTLDLSASGYRCEGGYGSVTVRVAFRFLVDGTPEAVSVTEVP